MSFTTDATREVFGISGVTPEILAVGFAKYSRSQDPIKVTLKSITAESSSKFHEKWVLGYGDASVADMAIVSVAFENVSILASKEIEDTRIASFQEKSTRYVPFYSVYIPQGLSDTQTEIYKNTVDGLMATYNKVKEDMVEFYRKKYPKPEKMSERLYNARLNARALDIARYVLPVGTVTNFGMVASARTIRYLVSKLKVSKLDEVRQIANELEAAATSKGYSPFEESIQHSEEAKEILNQLKDTAPTLVRHTEPREYNVKLENAVKKFVEANRDWLLEERGESEIESELDIQRSQFNSNYLNPVVEIISGLIYKYSGITTKSFYEISYAVRNMLGTQKISSFLEEVNSLRGPYDQSDRAFEVQSGYIFDTCMDYGAYRDLQRHRLCTQLGPQLDTKLGYEIPRDISDTPVFSIYKETMENVKEKIDELGFEIGRYLIPLGYRKRTLFKMNLRELIHIVNLRTNTGGHFSYRTICYDWYKQFVKVYPDLAILFNPVAMDFDADFYKR